MNTALQNLSKLPAQCLGILPATGEIIKIVAGETGYYKLAQPANVENAESFVDELNADDGISKCQRAAMEHGSIFGWHAGFADPDIYDPRTGKIDLKRFRAASPTSQVVIGARR